MNPEYKAKLKWRCRRGMLELDLLLGRFLELHFDSMNQEQFQAFEALLKCDDPDLYSWLMGQSQPIDRNLGAIVDHIRAQDKA